MWKVKVKPADLKSGIYKVKCGVTEDTFHAAYHRGQWWNPVTGEHIIFGRDENETCTGVADEVISFFGALPPNFDNYIRRYAEYSTNHGSRTL